jgi:hypothetical protein
MNLAASKNTMISRGGTFKALSIVPVRNLSLPPS